MNIQTELMSEANSWFRETKIRNKFMKNSWNIK